MGLLIGRGWTICIALNISANQWYEILKLETLRHIKKNPMDIYDLLDHLLAAERTFILNARVAGVTIRTSII